MAKKPITEYRWEAYLPADESDPEYVFKRGPIRNEFSKVVKYAAELVAEIQDIEDGTYSTKKRHLATYWAGSKIRILARTISPWTEMEDWEA